MDVIYKASATATGGRDGQARSSDGVLDVKLAVPKEMGGAGGKATNPEQLFAAGYSACFIGALKFVGGQMQVAVPTDVSVRAEVGIGKIEGGFGLDIDLYVLLPGMDADKAKRLMEKAHQVCPYSNATRNNVTVRLHLTV
ncbi:organic hydroperoxide resistance protein [Aliiglaciecola sp. CAU 1673]|uniref:organic hydroperoxide resistance protein n=1 Tax=Aliiglaciecola sp. CAU 1673 TaxID=3032595 RepID=UPI0023DCE93B|nr:organic hydroperoxide resistance protein [Aliiglaciecola sp. CAU 1673]MDF2178359.1 organic hydroperoxide resistance protein [Aliiglaciecola sp. CAU 1673]